MAREDRPTIVIKRIKKGGHGHHGGAWKIAYADFVTAMMAFFLLMWLLGSTTKGDLKGIADYFQTPLHVALRGGSGSGDSSSVIQGGGQDLTRTHGQVQKTDKPDDKKTINLQAAKREFARAERARLEELKLRIETAVNVNQRLAQFRRQIRLDITSEGLRIQLVDEHNRPMFDSGRAVLKDYTRELLHELARLLNEVDNKISLAGHTDAAPYAGGERGYSNWELSSDRANASRRELVSAGIDEGKVVRVVGLASSVPYADNPFDPSNRRISIIVLNKRAEEQLRGGGQTAEVSDPEEAQAVLQSTQPGPAPAAAPPAGAQ